MKQFASNRQGHVLQSFMFNRLILSEPSDVDEFMSEQ